MIREALNDKAMLRTSIFRWLKSFNEERQNMEDIESEGRPSISITDTMINTVMIIIKEERRITILQLHSLAVSLT